MLSVEDVFVYSGQSVMDASYRFIPVVEGPAQQLYKHLQKYRGQVFSAFLQTWLFGFLSYNARCGLADGIFLSM